MNDDIKSYELALFFAGGDAVYFTLGTGHKSKVSLGGVQKEISYTQRGKFERETCESAHFTLYKEDLNNAVFSIGSNYKLGWDKLYDKSLDMVSISGTQYVLPYEGSTFHTNEAETISDIKDNQTVYIRVERTNK